MKRHFSFSLFMGHMRGLPGRFSKGAAAEIMVSAPEVSPEEPIPATALPTMRALELGAVAQTIDPNSKIPRKTKKVYFDEKCVYNFPASG
jgi:hypothetical protein